MNLPVTPAAIPALTPPQLARVYDFEAALAQCEQVKLHTQHVFHAGLYARTIVLAPGQCITGALIKRATLLIVQGHGDMFIGDQVVHVDGYYVLPAQAGRKQVFYARKETCMTMLFATQAQSVEEAEREFTDEHTRLASLHGSNEVIMTGE